MTHEQIGAILENGPADWQILQQNAAGVTDIPLSGRWAFESPGVVQVRLVHEDTGVPVNRALDWQPAETRPDGAWQIVLPNVPAGGLYRLETRFRPDNQPAGEWSIRGDMRHFLGVGDLWIIAGQSNSAGYGRGPYHDPPELGVHVFRNSEQWALATQPLNESTDTRHPVNRETANPGHSPYLHFGRLLKQALNHPIGLIQTALGGSALSAWNPAESKSAVLFHNMVHCARQAGGRVRGIVWYQGESDANDKDAPTYLQRFGEALEAWRAALGDPDLPVITAQLNRVTQALMSEAGWTQVREAQRQAARRLKNVAVVPTLDLPLSDLIHNSPAGNMLLAERMARAALGMVYGRPVEYRAPDLIAARRLDDGRAIELVFEPVTSRMDTIDVSAMPFRVVDGDAEVAVTRVIYPGDHTIRLELAGPVTTHAQAHGCYGLNPPVAPMDMERLIPILGFSTHLT